MQQKVLAALVEQSVQQRNVSVDVVTEQLGMVNLLGGGQAPSDQRHEGSDLAKQLVEGQLKHELRIHPSQRLIGMPLAIALEFTAVKAEMTADGSCAAGNEGIAMGPVTGNAMALHNDENQQRMGAIGDIKAMTAMQMRDPEA